MYIIWDNRGGHPVYATTTSAQNKLVIKRKTLFFIVILKDNTIRI